MENDGLNLFRESELLHALPAAVRESAWFKKCWKGDVLVQGPGFYLPAMRQQHLESQDLAQLELQEDLERKFRVTRVILHELAHQWFGNLATMKDWGMAVMNEGFATLMAALWADRLFPDWQVWAHFATEEQSRAMSTDASQWSDMLWKSCHSRLGLGDPDSAACLLHERNSVRLNRVVVPPPSFMMHPHAVKAVFDTVTYAKGACLLRMLMHLCGPHKFRMALHYFLCVCAEGTMDIDQLFVALQHSCTQCKDWAPTLRSVQDLEAPALSLGCVKKWFTMPGFPVLSVTADSKGVVTIRAAHKATGIESFQAQPWQVPLFLQNRPMPMPEGPAPLFKTEYLLSMGSVWRFSPTAGSVWQVNRGSLAYAVLIPGGETLAHYASSMGKLLPEERIQALRGAFFGFRGGLIPLGGLLDVLEQGCHAEPSGHVLSFLERQLPAVLRLTRREPSLRRRVWQTCLGIVATSGATREYPGRVEKTCYEAAVYGGQMRQRFKSVLRQVWVQTSGTDFAESPVSGSSSRARTFPATRDWVLQVVRLPDRPETDAEGVEGTWTSQQILEAIKRLLAQRLKCAAADQDKETKQDKAKKEDAHEAEISPPTWNKIAYCDWDPKPDSLLSGYDRLDVALSDFWSHASSPLSSSGSSGSSSGHKTSRPMFSPLETLALKRLLNELWMDTSTTSELTLVRDILRLDPGVLYSAKEKQHIYDALLEEARFVHRLARAPDLEVSA